MIASTFSNLFSKPGSTWFWIALLCVIASSCATPIAPTGGPPDRTPPVITRTEPESGTVLFDGREVRIHFSKFINRNSLARALSIEPDLAIRYDIRWRRKSVAIRFDEQLPENTTIIVKIGPDLQDMRGNRLVSEFSLALSTGPEIDDGVVEGRVRLSGTGAGEAGQRVFLYREPFDPDERANYIAQTDTAGLFRFTHLSEGSYRAIWVEDINRNRIWEREREWAQPFHDSTFVLPREGQVDLGTIYVQRPDTVRPRLMGVGLLSSDRLRLRFDEEVFWDEESVIHLQDTLGRTFTEAFPLYVIPEDPMIVMAQSLLSLPEEEMFVPVPEGIADQSGNPVRVAMQPFPGSAQSDTSRLEIIGDNLQPGLFPEEPVIIGYNKLIDDRNILDSLKVVEGERLLEGWPNARVERHRLIIEPPGEWEAGVIYQILAWNPATERLRPYEPLIWHRNQWGSLEVSLADSANREEHFLTLFDTEGKIRIDTTFVGGIELDRLPPLNYTLSVFRDINGSGDWDSGSVIPFAAPEPYFVRRNLPVRAGFTSELSISFDDQSTITGSRREAPPNGPVQEPQERSPGEPQERSPEPGDMPGLPDDSGAPDESVAPEPGDRNGTQEKDRADQPQPEE